MKRHNEHRLTGLLAAAAFAASTSAAIVHVDAGAVDGAMDGMSWSDAFVDLQLALAEADPGDEIWVAAGTYRPAPPDGPRTACFQLRSGVSLYGGFAGHETAREERNWTRHETILSGDLNGDDGPSRSFTGTGENALCVLVAEGDLDETTVLDGFTITGGNANLSGPPPLSLTGGGLRVDAPATITIDRCTFVANQASYRGGALHFGGSPVQDLWNGEQRLTDCTFRHNRSAGEGGAVSRTGVGAFVVDRCTFTENVASSLFGGGALVISDALTFPLGSLPQHVRRCVFTGNEAPAGGAIMAYTTWVEITDCLIAGNHAAPDLAWPDGRAGGILYISSGGTVVNSTIVANTGFVGAGIMTTGSSFPMTIANSIVRENVPDQIGLKSFSTLTVHHCNVEGGWAGTGNLDADPLFAGAPVGDFRLTPGSPSIDAGDDGAVADQPGTDLDGNPRIVDGSGAGVARVDMGAYEHQPALGAPGDLDGDGDIDFTDLLALLAAWGECPMPPDACPADLDQSGDVGFTDLLVVLANWR